jgi:hypothetical protein
MEEGNMTQEQKTLVKLYMTEQILKFITENQDRFEQEIFAKYGFSPSEETTTENDNEEKHDARDNAPRNTDETAASAGEEEH